MKPGKLSLLVCGVTAALAAPAAKAALVIHYSFNGNALGNLAGGTNIDNLAGADGTFTSGLAGGSGAIVTSGVPGGFGGNALRLTPNADGDEVGNAPHILTGFTAAGAGITGSSSYTAMAWVNFANATGDNMIFGSNDNGTDALHHGSRNGNEHSGHWGDDLGPDQGIFINTLPGSWHHVAYTNDAATQAQSMYFDGVLVAGPGAGGATGSMNINAALAIGTSRNGGSFSGMLDEVRVYNTLLTQSEIQQAMTVVPEPSATLAGLAGLGSLLMLRRRRAVR
jgi:hypothetical protein